MIHKKCCFPQCKNSASDGFRLFAITKRKRGILKWLEKCNLPRSTPVNSALCEGHFGREMYEVIDVYGAVRLKTTAYPNVLIPNPPKVVESKSRAELQVGKEEDGSGKLVQVTLGQRRMFLMEESETPPPASPQAFVENTGEPFDGRNPLEESRTMPNSVETPLQSFISNEQFSALDDEEESLPLQCVLQESGTMPNISEAVPQSHISSCSLHPSAPLDPSSLLVRLVQAEATKIALEDRIQLLEERNQFLENRAQSLEDETQSLRDKISVLQSEVNRLSGVTNKAEMPDNDKNLSN